LIIMTVSTTARKTTRTRKASTAAPASQPVYKIHSLGEYEIDTRVVRTKALDEDEARRLTTEIQHTSVRLWLLVTEAHDRKAHLALGYDTWADYCKAELNMSESRSYQYLDTGHVMKALAATGIDVESYSPPPVRVVARVKDRLTEVKKVATAAIKEAEGDPMAAVDKAVRALAREPRKSGNGGASSAASSASERGMAADADAATETPRAASQGDGKVPCPACAGSGRVTQQVADKLLDLLKRLR
jgi:hypothetical protein